MLLVDVEDPYTPSWSEVLASSEPFNWLEGAKAELTSLHEMGVYQLVLHSNIPTNCSVLWGKFVCQLKRNKHGDPVRYKVQWVAKGFQQVWGRDFSKTTPPTAHLESLCIELHIATVNDWCIEQYNIKMAFLNGILPKEEQQSIQYIKGGVFGNGKKLPHLDVRKRKININLKGIFELTKKGNLNQQKRKIGISEKWNS